MTMKKPIDWKVLAPRIGENIEYAWKGIAVEILRTPSIRLSVPAPRYSPSIGHGSYFSLLYFSKRSDTTCANRGQTLTFTGRGKIERDAKRDVAYIAFKLLKEINDPVDSIPVAPLYLYWLTRAIRVSVLKYVFEKNEGHLTCECTFAGLSFSIASNYLIMISETEIYDQAGANENQTPINDPQQLQPTQESNESALVTNTSINTSDNVGTSKSNISELSSAIKSENDTPNQNTTLQSTSNVFANVANLIEESPKRRCLETESFSVQLLKKLDTLSDLLLELNKSMFVSLALPRYSYIRDENNRFCGSVTVGSKLFTSNCLYSNKQETMEEATKLALDAFKRDDLRFWTALKALFLV
ncbi:hypothetical protein HK098_001153 [Nowakowskiella sp. JEL0407]|nr:hypothetical protein HK098_001153 [Nowakowskiella sp. JEL0407]